MNKFVCKLRESAALQFCLKIYCPYSVEAKISSASTTVLPWLNELHRLDSISTMNRSYNHEIKKAKNEYKINLTRVIMLQFLAEVVITY